MSVNKVILIGHLGADPEMRYTADGKAVANMRLATTEKWGGEDKTEWHKVVAFGKTAELCGNHLSKGRQVYLEGRLQTRQWANKDGVTQYTTEVVADKVVFLGGGSGERQERRQDDQPRQAQRQAAVEDDSVPF